MVIIIILTDGSHPWDLSSAWPPFDFRDLDNGSRFDLRPRSLIPSKNSEIPIPPPRSERNELPVPSLPQREPSSLLRPGLIWCLPIVLEHSAVPIPTPAWGYRSPPHTMKQMKQWHLLWLVENLWLTSLSPHHFSLRFWNRSLSDNLFMQGRSLILQSPVPFLWLLRSSQGYGG